MLCTHGLQVATTYIHPDACILGLGPCANVPGQVVALKTIGQNESLNARLPSGILFATYV